MGGMAYLGYNVRWPLSSNHYPLVTFQYRVVVLIAREHSSRGI